MKTAGHCEEQWARSTDSLCTKQFFQQVTWGHPEAQLWPAAIDFFQQEEKPAKRTCAQRPVNLLSDQMNPSEKELTKSF